MSTGVDVFTADEQSDLMVDAAGLGALARNVLDAQGVRSGAEVSLLFVDEATIAELNGRFLGREGATDVLAFPIDDEVDFGGRLPDVGGSGPGGAGPDQEIPRLVGDVVLCPAVAARNAEAHGVEVRDELALLVVHGILHLLGMDHVGDEEATRMEHRERELLARFHQ